MVFSKHAIGSIKPEFRNSKGSAPASGAVFCALAENPVATKRSERSCLYRAQDAGREARSATPGAGVLPCAATNLRLAIAGTYAKLNSMNLRFRLISQIVALFAVALITPKVHAEFRAGAVVVDVSPLEFPVLVNGGMTSRSASSVTDPINARALVLADGKTQLAIVVVDSCMMARPVLDEAKRLASKRTGIRTDHMLISATHTHTAPSTLACLGTRADPRYTPYLIQKLAEAIALAQKKLQPARVGWNKANAAEFTALRRWVRRPDRVTNDPFGNPTVRATMHSGRNWDDVTGESGPEDPDLTMISVQTKAGKPLAILANFSMHYFSGVKALSADYYGMFCYNLKKKLVADDDFVGLMSHGCSGDIWRRDYAARNWAKDPPKEPEWKVDEYAEQLANRALESYQKIQYRADVDLAMGETRMTLNYRVPNKQMLEWAQRTVAEMGEREPKTQTEVYAMEQIILHERQQTEIVVQGLRIGDIAIVTTPNETYALTGLKLKTMSPLPKTMVIELANGGDGYIPPPEQHHVGGYNTWAARSAGLEVLAEPKIVEANLQLLEQVSGKPRKPYAPASGIAARAIIGEKPAAYWRLDEFNGPRAIDAVSRNDGIYETGVLYWLEGAKSAKFNRDNQLNRAPHFVGERMRARIEGLGDRYSVSLWFWNGMPDDARDVSGWMFSRGWDHSQGAQGDHLGIGGKSAHQGRIVFSTGSNGTLVGGKTELQRWTWTHATLVRDGKKIRVYINGQIDLEAEAELKIPSFVDQVFIGGRNDNSSNWEGRLDEVAVFKRALSGKDVGKLYQSAR